MELTVPFVATPTTTINPSDHPDLIPTGHVSEMAPPINLFKVMGKTAGGSPSEAGKGKGKGKPKAFRHITRALMMVFLLSYISPLLFPNLFLPTTHYFSLPFSYVHFLISRLLRVSFLRSYKPRTPNMKRIWPRC